MARNVQKHVVNSFSVSHKPSSVKREGGSTATSVKAAVLPCNVNLHVFVFIVAIFLSGVYSMHLAIDALDASKLLKINRRLGSDFDINTEVFVKGRPWVIAIGVKTLLSRPTPIPSHCS